MMLHLNFRRGIIPSTDTDVGRPFVEIGREERYYGRNYGAIALTERLKHGAGEVGAYFNPPREWYASIRVKFAP